MEKVKLSVCIATLNRGAFIGRTLDSIISQATNEVEIVVLDGGSTDNTSEVVQKYKQLFPGLRYFRHETPMGVDRDFSSTVEYAQGEYCWFMCDDDILKPGAIKTVLGEIKHNYGVIIANAEVRDICLKEVLESQLLKYSDNRIYPPAKYQDFFSETARYMSFIGCVVIKRELWLSVDKEKYFGTAFIHVGVIFQTPILDDILVIAKPVIAIRAGNAQWAANGFEIWFCKWPKLIWSFSHYSESAKNNICPKKPYKKIFTLLHSRGEGSFSLKEYDKWVGLLELSFIDKTIMKTIAILPGCLINCFGIIYYSLFRPSRLSRYYLKKSRFYYRNLFGEM